MISVYPSTSCKASVNKDTKEITIKKKLEKIIFGKNTKDIVSLKEYNLPTKQAELICKAILKENYAENLISITFNTNQKGYATAMTVETDEALALAVEEVENLNEEQGNQLNEEELQDVKAHYAELQTYFEANPDYFGVPAPFFTDKNTETTPLGAIMDTVGMTSENIDLDVLDQTIVGMTMALQNYVRYYGTELLKARNEALDCIDENMSDLEKLLVLHDYINNINSFDMDYSGTLETYSAPSMDDFIASTVFGGLVTQSSVCLGYASTYTYLIQSAFPEIYKNENGEWKTKEEISATYMVDYAKTKGNLSHYYNVVKINEQWYYVDVCFDDILAPNQQGVRVETDGNCSHAFFLCSHESFLKKTNLTAEKIDSAYVEKCIDKQYEKAWFSNVDSPIYYNDNYWFYVEKQINWEDYIGTTVYVDQRDQLKVRNRSTGEVTVLVDYQSGTVKSFVDGSETVNETIKNEYQNDSFYNKVYPGMQHSLGLYNDVIYINLSNKIYQYDLNAKTENISQFKEYNTILVTEKEGKNSNIPEYHIAEKSTDEIIHKVVDHPVCSISIKADNRMYVTIATNYTALTEPPYSVEEVNYKPYYNRFGESHQSNDKFYLCANIKETLDMAHITSGQHTYERVTVAPTCRSQGFDELRCSECGFSSGTEKSNITEKVDHHYVYRSDAKTYACTICNSVDRNAKEHNYGEPEFDLRKEGSDYKCQAVFECKTCESKAVVKCMVASTIEKKPTCLEKGEESCVAICTFQNKRYSYEEIIPVNATGHIYETPIFNWSDDHSMCLADFQCTICKGTKNDKRSVTCSIASDIVNANYEKAGKAVYTAYCQFNGKEYTDQQSVVIPMLSTKTSLKKTEYVIYATQYASLALQSNNPDEHIVKVVPSNPKVLKVSQSGQMKGLRAGKTWVTVTTATGKQLRAVVSVRTPKVILTATSIPLQVKKSTTAITVKKKISTDSVAKWSVSNKKIATVSKSGKITGKKSGTTYVTVTMRSGAKAVCKVKVQKSSVKLKKITLNCSKLTLRLKGVKSYQILVEKNPITAGDKISYKNGNKKIAQVSSKGKIVARRPGTTYITVKCGKISKKIKVTVKSK